MKPEYFAPVLALVGVVFIMGGKEQQRETPVGESKNAKRVSVIHVSFNVIGTVIGLIAEHSRNIAESLI